MSDPIKTEDEGQWPRPDFPCIESTVEFTAGPYVVRAWINETELKDEYDNEDFKRSARTFAAMTLIDFAVSLATLERVNAVHIRRETGDGVVIYTVW